MLDLIVVFNHPFPVNIPRIRSWYEPFGDVCVVTPVDGGGDVVYDTGSFLWQAAVVAALRSRPRRHGHTLVVHDDLLLAPGLDVMGLLGSDPGNSALHHFLWNLAGPVLGGWQWNARVALTWGAPMEAIGGFGLMDCASVLRGSAIYRRRERAIAALPEARLTMEHASDTHHSATAFLADRIKMSGNEFRFGLPLYAGFSDYFTFPNTMADDVEDFLARTVRCNLFCEVAIPTMLVWSGMRLMPCHDNFNDVWGADRVRTAFRSLDDVRKVFADDPDLIGIHPVKMSRFVD